MVQVNVVIRHVGQVVGAEVELAGFEAFADRPLEREVAVRLEGPARVVPGKFHAVHLPVTIVEGRQDDRRAELALIDEMGRLLVIGVNTHGQRGRQLLLQPEIVVVRAFGFDRVVSPHRAWGELSRVQELRDRRAAHELKRRR